MPLKSHPALPLVAVTGYVVDSVGGGKLIVGGGFFVIIR